MQRLGCLLDHGNRLRHASKGRPCTSCWGAAALRRLPWHGQRRLSAQCPAGTPRANFLFVRPAGPLALRRRPALPGGGVRECLSLLLRGAAVVALQGVQGGNYIADEL